MADLLLAAGATPTPLDSVDTFMVACMAGDRAEVARLVDAQPTVVHAALARWPGAVFQAVEVGRPDAVRLLAELGFGVGMLGHRTPLHQAAYNGDIKVVAVLLELGADPNQCDRTYNATALGWATHAHQHAVIELLQNWTKPA